MPHHRTKAEVATYPVNRAACLRRRQLDSRAEILKFPDDSQFGLSFPSLLLNLSSSLPISSLDSGIRQQLSVWPMVPIPLNYNCPTFFLTINLVMLILCSGLLNPLHGLHTLKVLVFLY